MTFFSIRRQLLRRLLFPTLIGIVLIYTSVILGLIYLVRNSVLYVTKAIEELQVQKTESLFNSKAKQVSNLFQTFFTDLDLNKIMIQDLSKDTIK